MRFQLRRFAFQLGLFRNTRLIVRLRGLAVRLKLLQLCVRRSLFLGDLAGVLIAVLVILREQVVIGLLELLHLAVFARSLGGGGDEALFVVQLHRFQIGLRLLELVRFLGLEREQHVARRDLLTGLDLDAGDLARLLDRHVIGLVGRDGALSANFGVDGAGGHIGRRHLGQRMIHDRVREEGQHQHDREENNCDRFDPFSFLHICFHSLYPFILSQSRNARCPQRDTLRRGGTSEVPGSCRSRQRRRQCRSHRH